MPCDKFFPDLFQKILPAALAGTIYCQKHLQHLYNGSTDFIITDNANVHFNFWLQSARKNTRQITLNKLFNSLSKLKKIITFIINFNLFTKGHLNILANNELYF